jgi:hypothetical protein
MLWLGWFVLWLRRLSGNKPVKRLPELILSFRAEARGLKGLTKIGGLEPVFHRVRKYPGHDRMIEEFSDRFLGTECAAGLQYPGDLAQSGTPSGDVVNDAEIENGIVGSIRRGDVGGVSNPEADLLFMHAKSMAREINHAWVQIEGIHPPGVEKVKNQFHADAAATSQLKSFAA